MPIKAKWIPFTKVVIEALSMSETGVYEVGKLRGNVVLYIGKSDTSIRARLLDHKGKTKFKVCTHFRKRRTNPDDASRAEKKLQLEYKKQYGKLPPLNKNISPDDQWKGILY
ncbi:hypothetical protein ACFLTK_05390 [Chloroflexota bacterium]